MVERIFGLFLFCIGLLFFFGSRQLEVAFSYDPLGPKAFPMALGVLLCVLSVVLMIRPERYNFPNFSVKINTFFIVALLVFYSLSFSFLGFLVSTGVLVFFVSRIFQGTNFQALGSSVGISVGTYILFGVILDVELPMGVIFDKILGVAS